MITKQNQLEEIIDLGVNPLSFLTASLSSLLPRSCWHWESEVLVRDQTISNRPLSVGQAGSVNASALGSLISKSFEVARSQGFRGNSAWLTY